MITKNASPRGLHFFFLLRALRERGVKKRKPPSRGGFTPSKQPTGVVCLKHGESFALCGARLKELFEKSSLRIFKNFFAFDQRFIINNPINVIAIET